MAQVLGQGHSTRFRVFTLALLQNAHHTSPPVPFPESHPIFSLFRPARQSLSTNQAPPLHTPFPYQAGPPLPNVTHRSETALGDELGDVLHVPEVRDVLVL